MGGTQATIDTEGPDNIPLAGESPPPEVIAGRYRLVRRIGEGTFGIVYEALDERIQKRVAVKVLRAAYATRERYVGRFHREALAAARLRHPNIVQVTDFSVLSDGRPFLVMEFLEGESLDRVLTRLKPSMSRAVAITRALGLALAEAHRHGIVHRDLKPANVIVSDLDGRSPIIKIVDFGIAKLTEHLPDGANEATTSMVVGTPMYMAPEQVRQRGPLDGRADIYALGIILYKMLTNTTPFAGRTAGDVMVSKVVEPPPPPTTIEPSIPSALETVVMTAIRIDRAERYPTADAMVKALDELEGKTAPAPAAPARQSRFLRVAITGTAVAAVATLVGILVWLGEGRGSARREPGMGFREAVSPRGHDAAVVPPLGPVDAGASAAAPPVDAAVDASVPIDAGAAVKKPPARLLPGKPDRPRAPVDGGTDLLFGE